MTLLVEPVSLMATHWRFKERESGCGVSTRRRAASYAAARTVRNIVVVRRQQRTSTHSLPGVRLAARQLASTHMAGQLRPVQPAAPTSANGLCARAWRWIGPNTPKADMMALSATPNTAAAESGRAATSSRGSIAPASVQAESPPTVRTTQMLILDGTPMRSANAQCDGRFPQSRRWLWRGLGDSR
ncbi:hypothetical protein V1278_001999 [Bradyrhizobium sp. AZCC 1577]